MVQKRNKMVNPLASALIAFTALAADKRVIAKYDDENPAQKTKRGAPGVGYLYFETADTNSPQSQRLPPASAVRYKP